MRRLRLTAVLLLLVAACNGQPVAPDQLPRGFPQPGSPYPYNSPGW